MGKEMVTRDDDDGGLVQFPTWQQGMAATALKTAAYATPGNEFVAVDATAGGVTVTLPAAPANKTWVGVKMVATGSGNTTTIACAGTDVLNVASGATTKSLSLLNQSALLVYAAAAKIWYIVADDEPLSQLDARFAHNPETVNTVAAAGSAQTLPDVSTTAMHDLTLNSASCALTLPTAAAGKWMRVVLRQDGTGNRVVTWPAAVKWSGSSSTLSTEASAVDRVLLECYDGTNWLATLTKAYA